MRVFGNTKSKTTSAPSRNGWKQIAKGRWTKNGATLLYSKTYNNWGCWKGGKLRATGTFSELSKNF